MSYDQQRRGDYQVEIVRRAQLRDRAVRDDGALDRLGELVTDDVAYDLEPLGGSVLNGVEAIGVSAGGLGVSNPVVHLVTNIVVAEHDGEVTARSTFIGVRGEGSAGSGVYDAPATTHRGWLAHHPPTGVASTQAAASLVVKTRSSGLT
jgi:hypothetical protein